MGHGSSRQQSPYIADDSPGSVAHVYMIHALCEGPIEGFADKEHPARCIKLNGTPLENKDGTKNFRNVDFDFRLGLPVQAPIEGFFGASSDVSGQMSLPVEVKHGSDHNNPDGLDGAHVFTIADPNADEVSIRFSLPGMYNQDDKGNVNGSTVKLRIEVKDSSANAKWSPAAMTEKQGKWSSKYEWAVRFPINAGGKEAPWQIRVSRLTPDSHSQALVNGTWIEGMAVIKNKHMMYPCVAHVAIKLDAAQFGSMPSVSFHIKGMQIQVPSNYDPDAGTYDGTWDGTFKLGYSNNPAWCFYDILVENRYGLGDWVKAHFVDKWGLYEAAQHCDQMVPDGKGGMEKRFVLNCCIQTREEAARVIQAIASSFHAMTYWASGAVFAAIDAPRDPAYMFAPANVRDGRFTYSSTARRARHNAMVVHWNDPADGYKLVPELVEMPDMIRELNFRFEGDRVAFGATSVGQARRDGRWALYAANKQTEMVVFGTGFEGCQLRPGDVVAIADPLRSGAVESGRVAGVQGGTIDLGKEVELKAGLYSLIVAGEDGRMSEAPIVAPSGALNSVTTRDLESPPAVNSMWMIASAKSAPALWRVVSAVPDGEGAYTITAITYDPDKFEYVDDLPPTGDPKLWDDIPRTLPPPQGLVLTEFLYKDKEDLKVGVTAQWSHPHAGMRFLPAYKIDEGNWVDLSPTSQYVAEVKPVEAPCDFWFSVRAQNNAGDISAPCEGQLRVLGKLKPPADVTNFRVRSDHNANLIFDWDMSDELDFSCYEIRESMEKPSDAEWGRGAEESRTVEAEGEESEDGKLPRKVERYATGFPSPLVTGLTENFYMRPIEGTRYTRFWLKAKDTSDIWSLNPAMAELQVYDVVDDDDVLTVPQKKLLAIQWAEIMAEQARLNRLAIMYGINDDAYNLAIAACRDFLDSRTKPKPWTDFSDVTYLGEGGGKELRRLLAAIRAEYVKLLADVAVGRMSHTIASGATEAMLESKFVDSLTGKIIWDTLDFASQRIFAHQMYIANFDNLIPNPNSEMAEPRGGWPEDAIEAAGLVYLGFGAYNGAWGRTAPINTALAVSLKIPCSPGDQFCFRAMAKGEGAGIGIYFDGQTVGQSWVTKIESGEDWELLECSVSGENTDGTRGAPKGTTFVQFFIRGGQGADGYFDALYARRMSDGLLLVDGSIKTQHLDAVVAVTGSLTSPNYVTGEYNKPPQGFKLHSKAFLVRLLGDADLEKNKPVPVQMELGGDISIGGRLAARLSDYDTTGGIHITRFKMPLSGPYSNAVAQGNYATAKIVRWPKGSKMFTVTNGGVKVNFDGTYEIEAQCPFFFGFGEPGWSDNNRVELLVNGKLAATSFCPMVIGRAGANYAHAGVATFGAGPIKAILTLSEGDIISLQGIAFNASYTRLQNGGINSGITQVHADWRDAASYMTIRNLLPIGFAPEYDELPPPPPEPEPPPNLGTGEGPGGGTGEGPGGLPDPGSGRGRPVLSELEIEIQR